jgi:hypothetical protein
MSQLRHSIESTYRDVGRDRPRTTAWQDSNIELVASAGRWFLKLYSPPNRLGSPIASFLTGSVRLEMVRVAETREPCDAAANSPIRPRRRSLP